MEIDPFDEELAVMGEDHPTPPTSEAGDEGPRRNEEAMEAESQQCRPGLQPMPRRNEEAAEAEPQPCRPGLQQKLHTTLCREACDTAPGTGSFARAEASLLFEGNQYNWPLSNQEDAGFDGSGPFLAARMQTCIANAMEGDGPDGGAFSDAIRCGSRAKIIALTTVQPIMKPLPDAPRDHEENASDLVVVTNDGRYLYANKCLTDGTVVPLAYAVRERSEALLCSKATMHFETDVPCPCGTSSTKHSATAKFDTTTGVPKLLIEHKTDKESSPCSLQPTAGWSASPLDIGRVLQVSTWPEHEVRALQANNVSEFVAPYETEIAALALPDKQYKITILADVLDAKLGDAIVKCGAVTKPALFCANSNTRLWSMHELTQSTLIDNQINLLCNYAMAMAKRDDGKLKLIVKRLNERCESSGWPCLLSHSVFKEDDESDEDYAGRVAAEQTALLRNALLHPRLRTWYDSVSLHQSHTARQLLKRITHRGLGPARDVSPFNPPRLLPFEDGRLIDFECRGSGGLVRRIEQSDLLTKTLPFPLKDLDSSSLPDLDTASEADMRAFGKRLGDEEATVEHWKFMKLYFNYEGGVMFRLSVLAKALVGDTFRSGLYVQLGTRKSNGDFIQGAGKGMPSKLDQDALGAYADSCPLSLLFYKEKVDGASPGFSKLEAKRYVLIDEANKQQSQSGGDQVINPNILRRLVPQGPEVKLSARQLYEGHLDFYAQIISLVVNLNNMYPGLMDGRRAQAIHLSTVFLPGDEYDRWVNANHDPTVLSAKWRDSVIAVAGTDGSTKHNVQKNANGNPYHPTMWKRMASVHLTCASLLARRCVKTGAWPAVPKVNEELTNLLLQEEASRASSTTNGVDAATLLRLADAWNDFAVPCETELKGGKSTVPHACKCTRDGHERWCVVGVDAFSTCLSTTDKPLARAVQATKGATHIIALLKQAVPGLETAHCDKAARAPANTIYAKERPRNAIVRWRAKSEGKLRPNTGKRKHKPEGAEQGKSKRNLPIIVPGVSAGVGAHGIPQTQPEIEQARAARITARKQREQEQKKQRKSKKHVVTQLSINTSKSDTSDDQEDTYDNPSLSEKLPTSEEESDEVEDEDGCSQDEGSGREIEG